MRGVVMSIVERMPLDSSPRQVIRAVRSRMHQSIRQSAEGTHREARKGAYRLALEHQDYWRKLMSK